jgi:Ca2+-binding EF-hand superfamily protein
VLREYEEEQKIKKNRFMIENKERVRNIYFQIDQKVNKFYPDLVRFNIPKLLSTYPTLTRKELFELFVQYKSLMKICIALNRSMGILKKGVDFKTFHQGVSQMSTESEDLARKIFNTINERNNNFLSWEEFLKGMITIKSDSISDKIDMFFKIIDTDGNGLLSYDEVLELSLMSLKRNIKGEDKNSEEVVSELAKYFADLIFKLVDVDKDDEIPLPKIKEVYNYLNSENYRGR